MKCPYCEKEMERVGEPEAIKYTFLDFKLFGEYCKSCKKLIIDTGITE